MFTLRSCPWWWSKFNTWFLLKASLYHFCDIIWFLTFYLLFTSAFSTIIYSDDSKIWIKNFCIFFISSLEILPSPQAPSWLKTMWVISFPLIPKVILTLFPVTIILHSSRNPGWKRKVIIDSLSPHFILVHIVCVCVCVCVCVVTQSCLTFCDPVDCSPPGSSVHGAHQAKILEWVAVSFSRGSS